MFAALLTLLACSSLSYTQDITLKLEEPAKEEVKLNIEEDSKPKTKEDIENEAELKLIKELQADLEARQSYYIYDFLRMLVDENEKEKLAKYIPYLEKIGFPKIEKHCSPFSLIRTYSKKTIHEAEKVFTLESIAHIKLEALSEHDINSINLLRAADKYFTSGGLSHKESVKFSQLISDMKQDAEVMSVKEAIEPLKYLLMNKA